MNKAMGYVGLAHLFEKRYIIYKSKELAYYERVECVFGMYLNFEGNHEKFLILSGKHKGQTRHIDEIASFRTLAELYKNNNKTFDIKKFIDSYEKECKYATFDENDGMYYRIEDKEFLSAIKENQNTFDESEMKDNKDISNINILNKKR